ncbi:MAG TPA: hypothetical protein VEL74_15730 [Thermoanaerobaculia bacterium]|nr:hypothetical protein [Thermoanaerobaculia bacterium]
MAASTSLARWISILAHPFVMAVVMAVTTGIRFGALRGGVGAAVAVGLVILPVALLMARQVRAGRWGNVDASEPRERPALFAVAILSLFALFLYLWLRETQASLLRGVGGTLALVVVAAVANRWIKVSLHMAFACLTVTVLVLLGSIVGWCLVPVIPALAWSRLQLARHRPVELIAGTALGAITGLAVHFL